MTYSASTRLGIVKSLRMKSSGVSYMLPLDFFRKDFAIQIRVDTEDFSNCLVM